MVHTDIPEAPWYVVESDVKKEARLNMMAHLLSTIPYTEVADDAPIQGCPTGRPRPATSGRRATSCPASPTTWPR